MTLARASGMFAFLEALNRETQTEDSDPMTSFHLAIVLSALVQSAPAPASATSRGDPRPVGIGRPQQGGSGQHPRVPSRRPRDADLGGDGRHDLPGVRASGCGRSTPTKPPAKRASRRSSWSSRAAIASPRRARTAPSKVGPSGSAVRSADRIAPGRPVVLDLHGASDAVPAVHARTGSSSSACRP